MRSVCQTFFILMIVASLLGAQDNLLGMKSIGSRSVANGQLVVIMSGRTQIAPNAEEQRDGTVKYRYVEGGGLVNSALPETNTRVTILELEKEVAIPGTNKKVQWPTLLVSAAKPDERLEFLEGGPKLVPLVFAPGAEITILLRVRLGDHIFESSDTKDPLRIRIEATNQGFSYIAGSGKLELAGKTSQFPLAPHETAPVGGVQGSSPRGADPKPVMEATVKAIYIQFAPRTRAEAGAKAERIVKQIKHGADFTSLAQQNSDDPISAKAGGTFGVFRSSDSLPPNIKAVIFTLKPGQVSDIVERPNGFYIFRLESLRQSDQ